MTGAVRVSAGVAAGITEAVEVPAGMILVGIALPEMTSTSFTISQATGRAGTYRTLKDPVGFITTPGSAITFTIGATSSGTFAIPPQLSALLNSWIKLTFDQSETGAVGLIFRQLA